VRKRAMPLLQMRPLLVRHALGGRLAGGLGSQAFRALRCRSSPAWEPQALDEFDHDVPGAKISVVGVGGAGSNAVDNMLQKKLGGIKFAVCNTDVQALSRSLVVPESRVQIGKTLTNGLGAGSRPEIGRKAAEEGLATLVEQVGDSDMCFITAGMGGGTGTGAAPVISRALKEKNVLTVGIVTKPFRLEGQRRMRIALDGIKEMRSAVDTLIVIPNEKVLSVGHQKMGFQESLELVNGVLYDGVKAVTDVIINPSLINLDFADVQTITQGPGWGLMGSGTASGSERARIAASDALNNPLLSDVVKSSATGILVSIAGGPDLRLLEVDEVVELIHEHVSSEANIIFGATSDESLDGSIRVSLIMTGPWEELSAEEELAQAQAASVRVPRSAAQTQAKEKTPEAAAKKAKKSEEAAEKPGFWSRWI